MVDQAQVFVRQELIPQRAAPISTTGVIAWIRWRLFSSPTNILLTIVSVLLLWFTVVPAVKFLLIDAVWQGSDRDVCLEEKVGRTVGACWPFVAAKLQQFIYGFYPQNQLWRVNLVFLIAILTIPPLTSLLGGTFPSALGWLIAASAIPAVLMVDTAHKAWRHQRASVDHG